MFVILCIHESKVHSLAFKCLVWPQLEYACQVWNPHLVKDIQMFEAIEKHAARWIHAKWNHDTYTWSKTTEVCKNFAGQALLTDVTIYVFHSCLILYIRGILYHLILIAPSRLLLIWDPIHYHCKQLTLPSMHITTLTLSTFLFVELFSSWYCVIAYCQPVPTIYMFLLSHLANICTCLIFIVIWHNL